MAKTTKKEEGIKESNTKMVDAKSKATHYGVFRNGAIVTVFNKVTHGDDFIKIAEAYAVRQTKKDGGEYEAREVKPVSEVTEPEDTINVVNVNGNVSRSFSLAEHGKDYKEVAAQFVEKHGAKKGLRLQD